MVTLQEVERQLTAIGANNRYWGRAEIIELQHILIPGERVQSSLNGRYNGGFATFVVTDQRLLLVDKKLFYLTVEDMRYDMIAEVDFGAQLLSGTIKVCTPTKNLTFTTFKPKVLRQVASYIQQRVMQVHHQYEPQSIAHPAQMQQTYTQPDQVPPKLEEPVAPTPLPPTVEPTPTEALSGMYAAMLGNQAVTGAEEDPAQARALPIPQRRNPYMNPPLLMRRRIGRFGPIGTQGTS